MATPWGLIASVFNKSFGSMSEEEKARVAGELLNRKGNSGFAYTVQDSPQVDERSAYRASAPHTVLGNIGDMFMPGSQALGRQTILKGAVEGNEAWMAPDITTQGAWASNPMAFNTNYREYYGGY